MHPLLCARAIYLSVGSRIYLSVCSRYLLHQSAPAIYVISRLPQAISHTPAGTLNIREPPAGHGALLLAPRLYSKDSASRGVTAPSREGPLDRRGGPLLECGGCPAGANDIVCWRREPTDELVGANNAEISRHKTINLNILSRN